MTKVVLAEISPLWEIRYTGVSNVVCEFARRALTDSDIDFKFTIFGRLIPREILKRATEARTGQILREYLNSEIEFSDEYLAVLRSNKDAVFLFTNTCNLDTHGRRRAQIVYDLSYFSFPEYHTSDNINFHCRGFLANYKANDLNFCISNATKKELASVTGDYNDRKNIVIPLGPSLIEQREMTKIDKVCNEDLAISRLRTMAKYFLFISTVEPRKNIDLVFSALARDNDLFGGASFVVVGRDGWKTSWRHLIQYYELERLEDDGRIIRIDYIGEGGKYALLKNCKALIYPSFYEGFGLPPLEAACLEVPVLASCASSIPEVLGPSGLYYDPYSIDSFMCAVSRFKKGFGVAESVGKVFEWAKKFTHNRMYSVMAQELARLM